MSRISFIEMAKLVLKHEGRPLTTFEIWDLAKKNGFDKNVKTTRGKTPWLTIQAKLYVELKNDPEHTEFAKTSTRPVRFYLK